MCFRGVSPGAQGATSTWNVTKRACSQDTNRQIGGPQGQLLLVLETIMVAGTITATTANHKQNMASTEVLHITNHTIINIIMVVVFITAITGRVTMEDSALEAITMVEVVSGAVMTEAVEVAVTEAAEGVDNFIKLDGTLRATRILQKKCNGSTLVHSDLVFVNP